jgi:poly-gamma-glutamate synthesis protein (capsule biosynthesis protein)
MKYPFTTAFNWIIKALAIKNYQILQDSKVIIRGRIHRLWMECALKMRISTVLSSLMLLPFLAAACGTLQGLTTVNAPESRQQPIPIVHSTVTSTAVPYSGLWLSASLPELLKTDALGAGTGSASEENTAALLLASTREAEGDWSLLKEMTWVYALAGPFYEIRDGVSADQLQQIWLGGASGDLAGVKLVMESSTKEALTLQWGAPSSNTVQIKNSGELLTSTWSGKDLWAIVPFESIVPKYKVLKIDGLSPLDKPLNVEKYPLALHYGLYSRSRASSGQADALKNALPLINRDESKMTVLIMSGTTALTRATAYKIDLKGTDYVISGVKDWFLAADLRHVSNEVSFDPNCPKANPASTSMRFCSKPSYIDVLKGLGINVVELTGNHENDYGPAAFAETVKTYQQLGWTIFGGGLTPEDARQPALVENNGNKIAFIGCNPVGPANAWVNETRAGVAKCDPEYYNGQIKILKSQGYVVVATFQHQEIYQYMYSEFYRADFRQAAESGADIVDGAQAHYPMGFEFVNNALIHYGMGNFLFDQMDYPVVGTRREFIDRHIIYNGKYLNTELLTALLTDYSRPRPMEPEERTRFLTDLFAASGWK